METYLNLLYGRQCHFALRLGSFCLVLALVCWLPSLWLHWALPAAMLEGLALAKGVAFGLCLAAATRTRRPSWIYFWILLASLFTVLFWNVWPLANLSLPIADQGPTHPWMGLWIAAYRGILQYGAFFLGIPAPFAFYGQHAPDALAMPCRTFSQKE